MQIARIRLAVAVTGALLLAPFITVAAAQPAVFCASASCQSEFKKLERMAHYGSGEAATIVAVAYAKGEGVEQNIKKARRHIKQAVRWREPMGMHQMSLWLRQALSSSRISPEQTNYLTGQSGQNLLRR